MAKRYYLSIRVGTGIGNDWHRDLLSDLGENYSTVMDGIAGTDRTLVIVAAPSHAELLKDARLFALPDFPLDGKLSSIRNATLNAMNTALTSRGYSITWTTSDAYRDVLRSVGRQLDSNFDENGFDVIDR